MLPLTATAAAAAVQEHTLNIDTRSHNRITAAVLCVVVGALT
jgi:hypothetical protein